jgi:transcription antitermination factor NusG
MSSEDAVQQGPEVLSPMGSLHTLPEVFRDARAWPRRHRESPWEPPATPAWYACLTRARAEKKVTTLLTQRGVQSYLPVVPRLRQWHDRKKRVAIPLFPSYVFAKFEARGVLPILKTPGVASVVRFDGRLAAIPDADIENIARFAELLADSGYEPPPVRFEKGQRIKIVSGPFEGVYGTVVEARGRRRVLVGLETIGLGFEVDVPSTSVKPIGQA